jgi:hypothetical protein
VNVVSRRPERSNNGEGGPGARVVEAGNAEGRSSRSKKATARKSDSIVSSDTARLTSMPTEQRRCFPAGRRVRRRPC